MSSVDHMGSETKDSEEKTLDFSGEQDSQMNISIVESEQRTAQMTDSLENQSVATVGVVSTPSSDKKPEGEMMDESIPPPTFETPVSIRSRQHSTTNPVRLEFQSPGEGTPAANALAASNAVKSGRGLKRKLKRGIKRPIRGLVRSGKPTRYTVEQGNYKGKVIGLVHELYTLTAGIMFGIRFSVLSFPKADVSKEAFENSPSHTFPPIGSSLTPPHKLNHTFSFKSYAPAVFSSLRERMDIDTESFLSSVCGDYNFIEFISNSKSGQFFFYSHDGRFMLKTQSQEESVFLRRILPEYHQHLTTFPSSLLCRILGMYRIEMPHLRRRVHFVVMSNVFATPVRIHHLYDLKGSTQGRLASPAEVERGVPRKDLNFVEDGVRLRLGSKKDSILRQLSEDATFLAKLKIMDYSLLLGIHDRSKRETDLASGSVVHAPSDFFGRTSPAGGSNAVGGGLARQKSMDPLKEAAAATSGSTDQYYVHPPVCEEIDEDDDESIQDMDFGDSDVEVCTDLEAEFAATLNDGASCPSRSQQHNNPTRCSWSSRADLGVNSRLPDGSRGDEIYYFGIIDILQQYTLGKVTETQWKSILHDRRSISSLPPGEYARRFVKFIAEHSE